MFDLGGSTGRLRACPFLGTWRALLCGELLILERLEEAGVCFGWKDGSGVILQERERRIVYAVRIAVDRCFSAVSDLRMSCRRGRLEAI